MYVCVCVSLILFITQLSLISKQPTTMEVKLCVVCMLCVECAYVCVCMCTCMRVPSILTCYIAVVQFDYFRNTLFMGLSFVGGTGFEEM